MMLSNVAEGNRNRVDGAKPSNSASEGELDNTGDHVIDDRDVLDYEIGDHDVST